MTSNTKTPSTTAPELVAEDRYWRWAKTPDADTWRMTWRDASQCARHLRFVTDLPDELFPWDVEPIGDDTIEIEADGARPLSSFSLPSARKATIASLFESLGAYLRTLHDHPSPEGFGPPDTSKFRHTFNAYMTAEFESIHRRLQSADDPAFRDQAIDALASLRRELSAFHPHGKSAWTVGRATPRRLAISRNPTRLQACVDFGAVALRPPEFDLATLRIDDLLSGDPSLADRAFWKGYRAALTRDLDRRIAYFERLIDLKRRLAATTRPSARRP